MRCGRVARGACPASAGEARGAASPLRSRSLMRAKRTSVANPYFKALSSGAWDGVPAEVFANTIHEFCLVVRSLAAGSREDLSTRIGNDRACVPTHAPETFDHQIIFIKRAGIIFLAASAS